MQLAVYLSEFQHLITRTIETLVCLYHYSFSVLLLQASPLWCSRVLLGLTSLVQPGFIYCNSTCICHLYRFPAPPVTQEQATHLGNLGEHNGTPPYANLECSMDVL